jgi:hypothetical protein
LRVVAGITEIVSRPKHSWACSEPKVMKKRLPSARLLSVEARPYLLSSRPSISYITTGRNDHVCESARRLSRPQRSTTEAFIGMQPNPARTKPCFGFVSGHDFKKLCCERKDKPRSTRRKSRVRAGKEAPQGLKPNLFSIVYGTTKVVPWSFYISGTMRIISTREAALGSEFFRARLNRLRKNSV